GKKAFGLTRPSSSQPGQDPTARLVPLGELGLNGISCRLAASGRPCDLLVQVDLLQEGGTGKIGHANVEREGHQRVELRLIQLDCDLGTHGQFEWSNVISKRDVGGGCESSGFGLHGGSRLYGYACCIGGRKLLVVGLVLLPRNRLLIFPRSRGRV